MARQDKSLVSYSVDAITKPAKGGTMINLSRVAIVKLVMLANQVHELLNASKDSVTLTKNGDEATIDKWGKVTWVMKNERK